MHNHEHQSNIALKLLISIYTTSLFQIDKTSPRVTKCVTEHDEERRYFISLIAKLHSLSSNASWITAYARMTSNGCHTYFFDTLKRSEYPASPVSFQQAFPIPNLCHSRESGNPSTTAKNFSRFTSIVAASLFFVPFTYVWTF